VVLHGLANDVGDLVVTAILDLSHGMKDPALNGLQPVIGMGNGPFENYIRGVIENQSLYLPVSSVT